MVAVAVCYSGTIAGGERLVQPLLSFGPPAVAHVAPVPYTALQGMFDASAPHGIHAYWKTHYRGAVPQLPGDEGAERVRAAYGPRDI